MRAAAFSLDERARHALRGVLRFLRRRPARTLALGVALELASMLILAPARVAFPGTPGAIGVAIAVLAALAAGPWIGALVAVTGWTAFFLLVAEVDPLALLALPLWAGISFAAGLVADELIARERELARSDVRHGELRRLDEVRSRFIALASHELRTPAAVIHGVAATLALRAGVLTEEQKRDLWQTLYQHTERLRLLVDQLLDLSRLEAAAVRIEPERLPVRRRLEDLVTALAGERVSEIELAIEPELETVADAAAFDRIVGNLIANALRYGNPPIVVAATQSDRHFRLEVEDRGSGVPPELVPQIFEPFARGESSRRASVGSGLGLSIAQSYAEAHGGRLLYEPAEPHGARFELVLPRLNAVHEATSMET
jgi:signal transduction histidine kinase